MLKKLWVKGFRNLTETNITFNRQSPVVIYGDNNQGKTNFLESISIFSSGASPIDSDSLNWVKFENQETVLGGQFSAQDNDFKYYIKIKKSGEKEGILNDKVIKRVSVISKSLPSIFLSADIIRLFKESAGTRRKELDKLAMLANPNYKKMLKDYERVLRQKNNSLKQKESLNLVPIWNEQLVKLAAEIVQTRLIISKTIEEKLKEICPNILPFNIDAIKIKYMFTRLEIEDFEIENYKNALLKKLADDFEKELILGYSLAGPQRDDFEIEINEKKLYTFYSRGINRVMAILFTVAGVLSYLHQLPLLLLDDTFAECDAQIKKKLIAFLQDHFQLCYTSVLESDQFLFSNPTVYRMEKGTLHHG